MKAHVVIFDLDGTLIDSAPSILSSIRFAFNEVGVEPALPLTKDIIGPPLNELFLKLLNDATKESLPQLIEKFKKYYDVSGYKETRIYGAVEDMLDELQRMNFKLYIATNKRIRPTLKILDYLNWKEKFERIYSLDYFEPVLQSKMAMLQRLKNDLRNSDTGAVYVGDRTEDAEAAEGACIPFFWASWGYSHDVKVCGDFFRLINPSMLPNKIHQFTEFT